MQSLAILWVLGIFFSSLDKHAHVSISSVPVAMMLLAAAMVSRRRPKKAVDEKEGIISAQAGGFSSKNGLEWRLRSTACWVRLSPAGLSCLRRLLRKATECYAWQCRGPDLAGGDLADER